MLLLRHSKSLWKKGADMNELSNSEKREPAVFFKRLCFDHIFDCTDGSNDKAQAYRIIGAIEKLQKELVGQGFNPR